MGWAARLNPRVNAQTRMARARELADEFAHSRLGDLPTAGYATTRQKATTDLVMFWLREIERNRYLLLSIVVDGWDKWRKVAGTAWDVNRGGRSTAMGTDLLKLVWDYMVKLAGENPASQLLVLEAAQQRQALHWDFRKATAIALTKAAHQAQAELAREQGKHRSKVYFS